MKMTPNLQTPHSQLIMWFQHEFKDIVKAMRDCSHHYDADHLNAYHHLEGDVFLPTLV